MNERLHDTQALAVQGSGSLVDEAQIGLFVIQDGLIRYANPALAELLGWTVAELIGQSHLVVTPPEAHERANAIVARRLAGATGRPGQMPGRRRDGSRFEARTVSRRIDFEGRPAVLVTMFDVSELSLATQRAEWSAGMLARTEALCRSGSFELDAATGNLTLSAGLMLLLGLDAEASSANLDSLAWVPEEERSFVAGIWHSAGIDEPFEFQHRVVGSGGRRLVVLHRGRLTEASDGQRHGVGLLQDITAQREAEQRIQELANHDEVTGLPNRAWLLDQIDAAIHAARWESGSVALLAFDVARIGEIKSSMGFGAGDTLAMALAARLREAEREGEIVARLGDTEFAVLLDGTCSASHEAVRERALELQRLLQAPVRLSATDAFPLCAIGIAVFPSDGDEPGALLEAAQTARLDLRGGAGVAFFSPETTTRALREMHLEGALRQAIERGEFELHYQPQVDLASGAIRGAEALLRWNAAGIGVVSPAEFIPIAERAGLIGAIGDWVLRHACEQIAAWRDAGVRLVRIGVNLSPTQLQRPDLARHLEAMLAQTGVEPAHLGIELTEGMLMADIEHAAGVLREIKAIGIEISLDDFGTGYSSLNSLSRLPIDVVKIDRSFVSDVSAATQQVSVTRAIINMAHGLQMKVLAEGVETDGQLALLASHHCDLVQGYWFSRPVPAPALAAMLAEDKRLPEEFTSRAHRKRTLLLVDDEENILSALKRLLRRDGYQIVTAASAAEGLQRLAEQAVDVIVSDQRMPGMTGVEFLRRAKESHPNTVRMVLSGYTELQSIIDAVNEGAIYKFLTKPWDDERLREHVAEAFRQKELADENRSLSRQVESANIDLARLNQRLEHMLEQQRRRAALLMSSAENSRAVLDGLPAAVVGVDPDGLIVYMNCVADGVLGIGLLGRALEDALPGVSAGAEVELNGQHFAVADGPFGDDDNSHGRLLVLLPQHQVCVEAA